MKKISMLFAALTMWAVTSLAQVNVKGYYRKDGTYVAPHVRTSPDNTVYNNYSYPGNYNPNKDVYTPSGSNSYYSPSASNNSAYSGSNELYRSTSPYIYPYERRTYITDKKGRQSGIYTVTIDSNTMAVRKNIYNVSSDMMVGHITEYYDGDMWIYDNNGKLAKRFKARKRK